MFLRILCLAVCVAVSLAAGPCAPNENFLNILKAIHKTPSYSNLSVDDKVMLTEIFAEAAACELTAYIQAAGYAKVLALIDHLTKSEAHMLNEYMQKHLQWEQSLAGMTHAPHQTHPSHQTPPHHGHPKH